MTHRKERQAQLMKAMEPLAGPPSDVSVGARIRKLRKARRWTQCELTHRLQESGLEITRSIVANWEVERSELRLSHLFHLVSVFGVGWDDLLLGPNKVPRPRSSDRGDSG